MAALTFKPCFYTPLIFETKIPTSIPSLSDVDRGLINLYAKNLISISIGSAFENYFK